MKFKAFLLVVSTIPAVAGSAQAQNWFKDDCTWHYTWAEPGKLGFERLTVEPGVTVTNGMTCRDLHSHLEYNIYNPNTGLNDIPIVEDLSGPKVCEVGDSVFFRNYLGELQLQYDFSMQPGDTLHYLVPNEICGYSIIVDSLGSLDLQGTNLRTQHVTMYLDSCMSGQPWQEARHYLVIERIGIVPITNDIYHPAYLIPQLAFNFVLDGTAWGFRCFSNSNFEYHLIDDCDYVILDTHEPGKAEAGMFGVFPNPALGAVTLVNRSGSDIRSARIFSINGTLEMELAEPNAERIEIGSLPQGVHILCLETAQGFFRQRLVKQ